MVLLLFDISKPSNLATFKQSWHILVQSHIWSRSSSNRLQSYSLLTSRYDATSSVNFECLTIWCKSSVYSKNNKGPNTDPCATPDLAHHRNGCQADGSVICHRTTISFLVNKDNICRSPVTCNWKHAHRHTLVKNITNNELSTSL